MYDISSNAKKKRFYIISFVVLPILLFIGYFISTKLAIILGYFVDTKGRILVAIGLFFAYLKCVYTAYKILIAKKTDQLGAGQVNKLK